jgi:hypothetical protein
MEDKEIKRDPIMDEQVRQGIKQSVSDFKKGKIQKWSEVKKELDIEGIEELKLERIFVEGYSIPTDVQYKAAQQVVDKLQAEIKDLQDYKRLYFKVREILGKKFAEISRLEAEKKEMIDELTLRQIYVGSRGSSQMPLTSCDWWQAFKAKYLSSQKE